MENPRLVGGGGITDIRMKEGASDGQWLELSGKTVTRFAWDHAGFREDRYPGGDPEQRGGAREEDCP